MFSLTGERQPPFQTEPGTAPAGFAGKQLALWFGGGLLLVILLLGNELWVYRRLEMSQEATRSAWRTLARELAVRHALLQRTVARGIDGQQLPIELGERFRLGLDSFSQSSDVRTQLKAAAELENVMAELLSTATGAASTGAVSTETSTPVAEELKGGLVASEKLQAAVEGYNTAVAEHQRARSAWGGRLLLLFIKLAKPDEFRLCSDRVD